MADVENQAGRSGGSKASDLNWTTFLLWTIFGGALSLHRFYGNLWIWSFEEGRIPPDMLRTLTLNYFFIGWILDLIQSQSLFARILLAHTKGAMGDAVANAKAKAKAKADQAKSACVIL